MISEPKFRELINMSEGQTLDFKSEPYRLDNDYFKSEFIKDILAMANTPREGSSFIIVGILRNDDGSKELLGVQTHPDDSDLQNIMNRARIEPPTQLFEYYTIMVDGKSYGVIEIKINRTGPFYPNQKFGIIQERQLYYRKGSKNHEAISSVEREEITRWFYQMDPPMMKNNAPTDYSLLNWGAFCSACHEFERDRYYLYLVGPDMGNYKEYLPNLLRVPLNIILDFDQDTYQEGGLYDLINSDLSKQTSVHLVADDNYMTFIPEQASYWYPVKGLANDQNSIELDWRTWNRRYAQKLQRFIDEIARASSGRPVTLICFWYAPEYVREVCACLDRAFGDAADYVFAFKGVDRMIDLSSQYNGTTVDISLDNILYGIQENISPPVMGPPDQISIPAFDGSFKPIEPSDLQWLLEDMEILHSSIENTSPINQVVGRDFLRGYTISWGDLNNHYDADRDITPQLKKLIEKDLEGRNTTRINLFHYPGAGGTSVAFRIGWDLRRIYPVVFLNRIVPGITVGRLRMIYKITGQSILVIIEGNKTIPDKQDQLYSETKAEQIPVVFFSVLRRFGADGTSERSKYMREYLSPAECGRFVMIFAREVPGKKALLSKIIDQGNHQQKTPFYIALATFEKDFVGVAKYIKTRLEDATSSQRELIMFIAMAYYYGHRSVLPQIFVSHLKLPENRQVRLEMYLKPQQLELFVKDDRGSWRPAHHIIAEETIKYILDGQSNNPTLWRYNLSAWAKQFISICRGNVLIPSDDLLDLVRRVFILRDEFEVYGSNTYESSYSKIIDDILPEEGKLSIFKELTDVFPEEAHFWGHLGRFFSKTIRDYKKAVEALDRAIYLSPKDSVLWHMKGMCYRRMADDLMKYTEREAMTDEKHQELVYYVQEAQKSFDEARRLNPRTEHPYVSPIQLLVDTVEFGYKMSKLRTHSEFLVSPQSQWYRELLDEAETLLEQVEGIKEGDRRSDYVMSCESMLQEVYDNYKMALEGWQNLLDRRNVFAPPIRRQITRAYFARSGRRWSRLNPSEIERIVDLMEQNMLEEPNLATNIRIWFQAIRFSGRQDIDNAIEKLTRWKAIGGSLDSYFYTCILHVLKAIDGSLRARDIAQGLINELGEKASNYPNRTRSYEWFGHGKGLARLVNYSDLGEWNDKENFYENNHLLTEVEGKIVDIHNPGAGQIMVTSCALKAFFVPAVANVYKDRDENRRVKFLLGFSYDGLRAWQVKVVD